jgi:uncharacterized MAPEG superfamily protein
LFWTAARADNEASMREVMLIAAAAALGTYFMVSPSAFNELLAWIFQLAR